VRALARHEARHERGLPSRCLPHRCPLCPQRQPPRLCPLRHVSDVWKRGAADAHRGPPRGGHHLGGAFCGYRCCCCRCCRRPGRGGTISAAAADMWERLVIVWLPAVAPRFELTSGVQGGCELPAAVAAVAAQCGGGDERIGSGGCWGDAAAVTASPRVAAPPPPPPLLRAPSSLPRSSILTNSVGTAPLQQPQPRAGTLSARLRERYLLLAVTTTRGSAATKCLLSATVCDELCPPGGPCRGGRGGGGGIRCLTQAAAATRGHGCRRRHRRRFQRFQPRVCLYCDTAVRHPLYFLC